MSDGLREQIARILDKVPEAAGHWSRSSPILDELAVLLSPSGEEMERLRVLQTAAERWHDAVPRDNPEEAAEAEGALVLAVEKANPAKYGA